MIRKSFVKQPLVLSLAVGLIAGCSSMQPTPMMPSQPARIGGPGGVTRDQEALCRQEAYQAAKSAKETNVAKEVGSTVAGAALGAVIGNALEPDRPRGPSPRARGPGGPGGPRGPAPRRPSDPGWGGVGGVTGAAAGAAASQAMIQDPQQVYDIRYRNCIAAYANAQYDSGY